MKAYMSDKTKKRIVIVDTSNEIEGDGDIPHEAVGASRRMQVSLLQIAFIQWNYFVLYWSRFRIPFCSTKL